MNPLVPYLFAILAVILAVLTWRTVAVWFRDHGSPENMAKRMLLEARKGELMYRAAAEQSLAIADGYAATVQRLTLSVALTDSARELQHTHTLVDIANTITGVPHGNS
jgi:hypothetical protein